MSNYRQAQYDTPYNGQVAAYGGSELSDEFLASSPQLLNVDGSPVVGYAQLASKWTAAANGSGGVGLTRAAINVRCQAAELGVVTPSNQVRVAYMKQPLPPLVSGVPREICIYGRSTLATMQPSIVSGAMAAWEYIAHGIFVVDSFGIGTPGLGEGGVAIVVGQMYTQAYGDLGDETALLSGVWETDADGKLLPDVVLPGSMPYYRIRLSETLSGGSVVQQRSYELGTTGADWIVFDQNTSTVDSGQEYAMFGFLVTAIPDTTVVSANALCDFIRYENQPYAELATRIGGAQQFGAV